jgi:hypothetical protein
MREEVRGQWVEVRKIRSGKEMAFEVRVRRRKGKGGKWEKNE